MRWNAFYGVHDQATPRQDPTQVPHQFVPDAGLNARKCPESSASDVIGRTIAVTSFSKEHTDIIWCDVRCFSN